MEKPNNHSQNEVFACFEQAETHTILPYISLSESNQMPALVFNSEAEEADAKKNKRQRIYSFHKIYNRSQKFKYYFCQTIKSIAESLLRGESQGIFIYGTQEKSKDKMYLCILIRLYGESQNSGLLLLLISQLFEQCHQKQLQESVTLKLSCSTFKNGKFYDVYGGNKEQGTYVEEDLLQGSVLLNIPQVIIRNVKTGLKLINIIIKMIKESREEMFTENMIFTIKVEIDHEKKEEETDVYCISKLHIIKLANPSINSSLKGVNKNNSWFINIFNYLHTENVERNYQHENEQNPPPLDDFTNYLKEAVFRVSSRIYGFISITNKMSSNECLSALIFANYLHNFKLSPIKFYINLPNIGTERNKIQHNLLKMWRKNPVGWNQMMFSFFSFLNLLDKYMQQFNFLEYEYSLVLGEGCDKLNKYIFTEELEDFYYSKKVGVKMSEDLLEIYKNVRKTRIQLNVLKTKIVKLYENFEGEKEDVPISKLLNLLLSLSYHFLYEVDSTFQSQLVPMLQIKREEVNPRKKESVHSIIAREEIRRMRHSDKEKMEAISKTKVMKEERKKSSLVKEKDDLDMMFKNKNVDMKTKVKKLL